MLDKLQENEMIDKRNVLWWQLGFEGRKVISEEEFERNLRTVEYGMIDEETGEKIPTTCRVWPDRDVPIVIRRTRITGVEVDGLVTINPMSHVGAGYTGWRELQDSRTIGDEIPIYRNPHFRGVVIDQTPEFVFWTPFTPGGFELTYSTEFLHSTKGYPDLMLSPVASGKFYRNLIARAQRSRGGRLRGKKVEINLREEGLTLVPYYEFDHSKDHVMVYPGSIFPETLDLPLIVRGNSKTKRPSIVGVGYPHNARFDLGLDQDQYSIVYRRIGGDQEKSAKNSLIRRLGRV